MAKNLIASTGDKRDAGSIPGSGGSPGEGKGNPLQHSYLKNPMDRRAWRAARVRQGGHKSDMTEPLNNTYRLSAGENQCPSLKTGRGDKFSLLPSSSPFETLNGFDGGHPH